MGEILFKSHNIGTFQSLDSDVLCNKKFELHTVRKESVTISNVKSVSVITEICKSVDNTGLIVSIRSNVFALISYLNSFYFFDPSNISCYIQEDVPFVFKFKGVCDIRHFLLLQFIDTTWQIKSVKIMVNGQDKSSITRQYLNNQRRPKRKICQQQMPHVQSVSVKITRFKKLIIDGPFYICIVCNRSLYKRSVIQFHEDQFEHLISDMYTSAVSFDEEKYICKTCARKIRAKHVPYQAVINKLQITNLQNQFCDIRILEKILVSKRLLFKKVVIMPKGQSPKMKGSVCNMPVEIKDVRTLLPRQADSNGLVIIELKRKLEYRGHVYFEPVPPDIVLRLLHFLKANNDLYKDVTIMPSNIPTDLVDSLENENAGLADVDSAKESLEPEESNLDRYRIISNETSLISNILEIPEKWIKKELYLLLLEKERDLCRFLRLNIVKNLPMGIKLNGIFLCRQ